MNHNLACSRTEEGPDLQGQHFTVHFLHGLDGKTPVLDIDHLLETVMQGPIAAQEWLQRGDNIPKICLGRIVQQTSHGDFWPLCPFPEIVGN